MTSPSKDSVRVSRLNEIFERSLEACTKSLTYEKLAQCYPVAGQDGEKGLRQALHQAMSFWENSSKREFRAILEERDIPIKLRELDLIVKEARERKQRYQESNGEDVKGSEKQVLIDQLTPDEVVKAHLISLELQEASLCEDRIQQTQSANKQLLQLVDEQEREITLLLNRLEGSLEHLQQAVGETNGLPDQEEMVQTIDGISEWINY
ncbi:Nnf1-domain-containing protein [Lipomyces oligophaga]|uniref:Nnf1-domain-containing protein n=1 Tax=Lipomyces oligophaga TaxID=45792 RepID=UPI0034CD7099